MGFHVESKVIETVLHGNLIPSGPPMSAGENGTGQAVEAIGA
jgi:hypothetical protein